MFWILLAINLIVALITEQQISDVNPFYELANTTRILPHNPQPVPHYVAHDAHPSQLRSQQRTLAQHGKQLPYNPYSLITCMYIYIYIYIYIHIHTYKPLLIHLVLAFHQTILTVYLISIIYFTGMLPQHPVYRNELNCECFNVTLARKKCSSLRMIWGSKHVGAILSVFMWNYISAFVGW